jgi:hypothetical protein
VATGVGGQGEPGYVTILVEMNHDARVIPLDGRPHIGDAVQQWTGDSRGRWEGTTLVVETTNLKFNHQSRFGVGYLTGLSDERLRVVERFTMNDANTLTYRATIEDPTVFVRPWTVELSMARTPGRSSRSPVTKAITGWPTSFPNTGRKNTSVRARLGCGRLGRLEEAPLVERLTSGPVGSRCQNCVKPQYLHWWCWSSSCSSRQYVRYVL